MTPETTVTDTNASSRRAGETLGTDISVLWYEMYRTTITPIAAAPSNRYATTRVERGLGRSATDLSIITELKYNRSNQKNVTDVKGWKNIEPTKDNSRHRLTKDLFGWAVTVHELAAVRDINNNDDTKQRFHFFPNDMALLDKLVQPVIQTASGHATFNIRRATGDGAVCDVGGLQPTFPAILGASPKEKRGGR